MPQKSGPPPAGRRPVALVTGATAGIGNAFARALAARGHDLVLVARDAARLERVAEDLRARHGCQAEVLAADLTDRAALERVAERLRDPGRPVDVLVSNAGFGAHQHLLGGDLAREERLLDLLVRAVLVLTHAAMPGMVQRGYGHVVTVSSVAGFLPSGTYSAAKAWATTFTSSLTADLAGTGVTATVLCPGYTHTEFHARAGIAFRRQRSWQWLDADRLVADCLADVERGKVVSIPGRQYRAAVFAMRHLPLAATAAIGRRRAERRARNAGAATGPR